MDFITGDNFSFSTKQWRKLGRKWIVPASEHKNQGDGAETKLNKVIKTIGVANAKREYEFLNMLTEVGE